VKRRDKGASIPVLEAGPFSQERLNEIFRLSPRYPDRLLTRESGTIEFKESFNWGSKNDYAKTMAAFANAKGGYIVFGVKNRPHKLVGLKTSNFEEQELEVVTAFLNETFAPEICWEMHLYEFSGMAFGMIFVEESRAKPVVALKNQGTEVKEADIYYRYRARSQRARYAELRGMLDEIRHNEQRAWLQHIERLARVGVDNAALMNTLTGEVSGRAGSFLIDEDLLPRLKFIREGRFVDKDGAPTLKLIGDVTPVGTSLIQPTRLIKTKGIRTPDIIEAFLNQDRVPEPAEYVKQICFETSGFLPVYYYLCLAKLTRTEAIEAVNPIKSTSQSKATLLRRLGHDEHIEMSTPTGGSEISRKKLEYRTAMLAKCVSDSVPTSEVKYCLHALRSIEPQRLDHSYILPLLRKWYDCYYADRAAGLAHELRCAICYADWAMYHEKVT
jgi:hypothetical protein